MDQETSDYMFIYLDIILEYLDRMQKSKYMMGNLNRGAYFKRRVVWQKNKHAYPSSYDNRLNSM